MAHSRSTKKRIRQNDRRKMINKAATTRLRNVIRKTEKALAVGNIDDSKKALPLMIKTIDRAVADGYVHKNNAARKKSRIMKRYNSLSGLSA